MKLDKRFAFVLVVVVLAIVGILLSCKSREGYSETMIASDYDNYMVQRPNFKANLSPRFDPYRTGGFIKASYPPAKYQASGPNPMSDSEYSGPVVAPPTKESYSDMDFTSVGKQTEEDKVYKKTCDTLRNEEALKLRSAQGYSDPSELLPTPDLRNCLKDPSNPENYMYDRTIFAPLKRRNWNNVDWIRGDLRINPINFGWFYAPTIPSVDTTEGAMKWFGSAVDNQDTLYSNGAPIISPTLQAKMDYAEKTFPMGDFSYHFPK